MVRFSRTRRLATAGAFGLLATIALARAGQQPPPKAPADDAVFQLVSRGDITQSLVERGTLEPVRQADAACRVRGGGRIKWVVGDGTLVKAGDKLA
jgi:multidrug efflux pump subunit AcrA (membrane-fusion protein)